MKAKMKNRTNAINAIKMMAALIAAAMILTCAACAKPVLNGNTPEPSAPMQQTDTQQPGNKSVTSAPTSNPASTQQSIISKSPIFTPAAEPTAAASLPINEPTNAPTYAPTNAPTPAPTKTPSPTSAPTDVPTAAPTPDPTPQGFQQGRYTGEMEKFVEAMNSTIRYDVKIVFSGGHYAYSVHITVKGGMNQQFDETLEGDYTVNGNNMTLTGRLSSGMINGTTLSLTGYLSSFSASEDTIELIYNP